MVEQESGAADFDQILRALQNLAHRDIPSLRPEGQQRRPLRPERTLFPTGQVLKISKMSYLGLNRIERAGRAHGRQRLVQGCPHRPSAPRSRQNYSHPPPSDVC